MVVDSEHLSHWGILGMKWGIRRFQNPDGSLTDAGRARRKMNPYNNVHKELTEGTPKEDTSEEVKARTEKEYNERKERAVKSGTAAEVMRFKGDLTSSQLQEAINRIKNENSLKELVEKEQPKVKTGKDKINSILSVLDVINNATNKALGYAQTAQKVKDLFGPDPQAAEKARKEKVQEVIRNGSVKAILANFSIMTTNEIEDAKKRLNLLSELSKKEEREKKAHNKNNN